MDRYPNKMYLQWSPLKRDWTFSTERIHDDDVVYVRQGKSGGEYRLVQIGEIVKATDEYMDPWRIGWHSIKEHDHEHRFIGKPCPWEIAPLRRKVDE